MLEATATVLTRFSFSALDNLVCVCVCERDVLLVVRNSLVNKLFSTVLLKTIVFLKAVC